MTKDQIYWSNDTGWYNTASGNCYVRGLKWKRLLSPMYALRTCNVAKIVLGEECDGAMMYDYKAPPIPKTAT